MIKFYLEISLHFVHMLPRKTICSPFFTGGEINESKLSWKANFNNKLTNESFLEKKVN